MNSRPRRKGSGPSAQGASHGGMSMMPLIWAKFRYLAFVLKSSRTKLDITSFLDILHVNRKLLSLLASTIFPFFPPLDIPTDKKPIDSNFSTYYIFHALHKKDAGDVFVSESTLPAFSYKAGRRKGVTA
jgi:hypothetical protein